MKHFRLLALALTVAALTSCGSTRRSRPRVVVVPGPTPPRESPRTNDPDCEAPVYETTPERSDPLPPPYAPRRSDPYPVPDHRCPVHPGPGATDSEPEPREHPVFDEHPGRGHGVNGTDPKTEHPVFGQHPGKKKGHARKNEYAKKKGHSKTKVVIQVATEGEETVQVEQVVKTKTFGKKTGKPAQKKAAGKSAKEEAQADAESHTEEAQGQGKSKEKSKGKSKDKAKDKSKGKGRG